MPSESTPEGADPVSGSPGPLRGADPAEGTMQRTVFSQYNPAVRSRLCEFTSLVFSEML